MSDTVRDLAIRSTSIIETMASQMGVALPSEEFSKPEFVPESFKAEFLADFDEDTYHGDTTAVARGDILAYLKSPAHFVARRQEARTDEDNERFRFGRVMHQLFLETEKFKKNCILIPEFVGFTKDGKPTTSANSLDVKAKKEAFWASLPKGAIACTREELVTLFGMAKSISRNEQACNLLFGAKMEMTGYARDPITGLKLRIRTDFLNADFMALGDLKSTVSAAKDDFSRSIWNYRYDIQVAYYAYVHKLITGDDPKIKPFVAIEKTPPYPVQVYVPIPKVLERGMKDVRKALDGIARSLQENHWPQYFDGAVDIDLPFWAYRE